VTAQHAPEIRVEAPEELSALAARLRRIDPVRLRAIATLVGLQDAGAPITVILVPERADFAKRTPRWIAGFAHGEDSTIVLFPQRSPSYPYDSLEDVLQHEIAHVLIARAAGGRDVPRWFHEGLALAAERPWGLEDRMRAAFAIAMRNVGATALDRLFEGGESEQARAYAIAGAWMRDILRRHGANAPARILREMAASHSFNAAYALATGESVATSAAIFWRESWWYQAVPLFTSTIVLWFAVTVLALFAIRTRRVRNAARRARWDAEERRTENAELRTEDADLAWRQRFSGGFAEKERGDQQHRDAQSDVGPDDGAVPLSSGEEPRAPIERVADGTSDDEHNR
jgi:hypothetical protein